MRKKSFRIALGIMTVIIGALVWMNCTVKREPEPDRVFPMADARIEWTGAGYNGIFGR